MKTISDCMFYLKKLSKHDLDYKKEYEQGERYLSLTGTFFKTKKEAREFYRDAKKEGLL
jgi:hypothetical protein